jgi:C4-dicarboxylate-specific signal transduction histidine kinase
VRVEWSTEELVEADRLAGLGLLTAYITHDMINPLSAILNLAMVVRQLTTTERTGTDPGAETGKYLGDLIAEAGRLSRLVSELRNFSPRPGEAEEGVDLNSLVESALLLCAPRLKLEGISVATGLAADLPWLRCNRARVHQAVRNLVLSAGAAVEGCRDARVAITTGSTDGGNALLVEVRDNGAPVQPQSADALFAPFAAPRSCGLALPAARAIAEAHGGRIEIAAVGEETSLRLRLPLSGNARHPR